MDISFCRFRLSQPLHSLYPESKNHFAVWTRLPFFPSWIIVVVAAAGPGGRELGKKRSKKMRDGPLIQLCYFITHDEYVWHTLVLSFFSVCYDVLSDVQRFKFKFNCWTSGCLIRPAKIDSTTLVSQSVSQLRSATLSGLTFLSFWRNVSKSTLWFRCSRTTKRDC